MSRSKLLRRAKISPPRPEAAEPLRPAARSGLASVPGGIRVRQYRRSARLYVPGLAAAASTFWLGGLDGHAAIRAAVFGIVIVAVSRLLRDFPYPLRLMPASRVVIALLPLFAGAVAVASLAVVGAEGFALADIAPGFVIAMLSAIAVEVVGDAALAARPLRIAVLGSADFVPAIRREIEAIGGRREIEVIGWLNLGARFDGAAGNVSKEETLGRVRAAITEHEIDLLVRGPGSGASRSGRDAYDTIAAGCLDLPIRMIDGNQLYEQLFGHVPIGTIDSAWFLSLMHPSFRASSMWTRRAVDLIVGSLAAVIALPVVVLAAIAIKVEDRGPAFYRQRRVGEHGREFDILKLRTMRTGAQASGARWASAGDGRITRVGRVLRRLHLDELPQLRNVLRGDMTLVGPRPEQPQITAELERVFPHYSRRQLVKPGVTGWAQIRCGYAGSELGAAWKLCHDLFYLKHSSLLVDLLIMIETIVIAARDSHRPIRAPYAGFLYRVEGAPNVAAPSVPRVAGHPVPSENPLNTPPVRPVPTGAPLLG